MRNTHNGIFTLLPLLALFSAQAYADYGRTIVSPPGVPVCEKKYYDVVPTIAEAIAITPAGGTISICPGIYAEQVVLAKTLTLQGVSGLGQAATVIVPPPGGLAVNAYDLVTGNPIAAQVLITAGTPSYPSGLINLTVDATGNGITGCSPDLQGVLVQNASATMNHIAVRNQIPGGALGSCLTGGEGIFVQSAGGGASTVIVESSSVHSYNTNGITGNGSGTTLNVVSNTVQGNGVVSGGPVQNGIQLGYGATGKVQLNTVSNHMSGSPTPLAADILLYDTAENSGISVNGNILSLTQLPIGLETMGDDGGNLGDGVSVTKNEISGAPGDAIDVCTNGNSITKNSIYNSTQSAVHFDASCGLAFGGTTGTNNTGAQNFFLESACAGILDDTGGTGGNITTPANTFESVPFMIAYSTSSCPYVAQAVSRAGTKRMSKVSPRR